MYFIMELLHLKEALRRNKLLFSIVGHLSNKKIKEKGIVIITFVTSEILLLWFSYYLFEVHLFAFFSDFIFIDLIHRNTQIFIFRQLAAFLVFYQYIRSLGKPLYIGENKSYFSILTGKQNTKYYQAKI